MTTERNFQCQQKSFFMAVGTGLKAAQRRLGGLWQRPPQKKQARQKHFAWPALQSDSISH
jgi:hypothetical protein